MGDIKSQWDEVLLYVTHKENCERPYDAVSLHQMGLETLENIVAYYTRPENSLESIQAEALAGNGYSKVEVAIHYLLGFRTSKDETKAEELLKEVFKDRSLPDIVRARAASHLACIYHGRFAAEEVDVSDAMPVLAFSSTSVDMGLTSPNILRIVRAWVLARSHKVGEHPVVAPLWAALDARDKEMEEEREFRYRKVKRAPNKYQCANPACSIQSLRRGPLKKCAGKCDADVKPYYCERSCQVAHWKQHKSFCKPGMVRHSDPIDVPAAATQATLTEVNSDDSQDDEIETVPMAGTQRERDLATRSIEIENEDGSVTILQSSTMTAAGLKTFKAGVEKKERQRRKAPITT